MSNDTNGNASLDSTNAAPEWIPPRARNSAVRVDWDLVKQLWCAGLPPNQIVKRVPCQDPRWKESVISKRAERYRWGKLRAEVCYKMTGTSLDGDLGRISGVIRHSLASTVEKLSSKLEKNATPSSPAALAQAASTINTVVNASDKLFGWSQQYETSIVSVQSLSEPNVNDKEERLIDVGTLPESRT